MVVAETELHRDEVLWSELAGIGERLQRSTVQVRSEGRGHGSGVIWSAEGDIITNAHVAHGPRATAVLWDGREFDAEVLGHDRERDLAHLRVDAVDLPALPVADSDELRVGQLVLAMGNPLGFTGALTMGIIHAIAPAPEWGRGTWVQADVQLLPGNSGGPLTDAQGRVVGINSMVAGGLGLAVPSNAVDQFLRATGARPHLGVTVQPVLVPSVAARTPALLVVDVAAGSAADAAGVLVGDILLGVNGRSFEGARSLAAALYGRDSSGLLRFDLLRGGVHHTVDVKFAAPDRDEQGAAA